MQGGDWSAPVEVQGLSDVVALSVGAEHNCALRHDGRIQCWGRGASGRLGHGANDDSSEPVFVLEVDDAIGVAAGDEHSCAVRANGRAVCWGNGESGRLGDGEGSSTNVPAEVDGLSDAFAISAGSEHSCAVQRSGEVLCWGAGGAGRLGNGNDPDVFKPARIAGGDGFDSFVAIATGGRHSCALNEGGEVFCWGAGELGQLGTGFASIHATPVRVNFPAGAYDGDRSPRASGVSTGLNHTCARLATGSAWCWGVAQNGILGSYFPGVSPRALAPTEVPTTIEGGTTAYEVRSISAGNGHSCAILAHPVSGSIRGACTGAGGRGRLGTGDTVNVDQLEPIEWP